jgi:2-aminoadipate transaminase
MNHPIDSLVARPVAEGPPLFFPQPEVPIEFNFDQGNPARETFPLDDLLRMAQVVVQDPGSISFDYFDPATGYEELVFGFRGLRDDVAGRLGRRDGRELTADSVILTSGSVQGISLVAHAFIDPGDVVFVEAATFPYALRFFESAGAHLVPIRVDDDGMDIDELERAIDSNRRSGLRPKLVYTIPTFQLPTGVCMSLDRRRQLVALAEREQLVVHEDNVYAELRYEGEPLPSLLSLDSSGLVIQSDSFSKTVAPGLRLGWVAGVPEAVSAAGAVREDLGVSQFISRVMSQYLRHGLLEPHLEHVRGVYKAKRDAAVDALERYCKRWVSFRVPAGSFFLWLEINTDVDWDTVARRVQAEGVFCRPGERFSGDGSTRQFLRLAYSNVSIDVIERGVEALGRALDAA